jgi:tetratricopeptide (TPR) repeat protein
MSREQANTFRKHRDSNDPQGNLAWAARVQQKALRQNADAAQRMDVESDFELGDAEKVMWRLMKLARRYMDLEHCGVIDVEKMRAFMRGLVSSDVVDIVEVDQAKALLPAELKRVKAEVEGRAVERPRQPLKGRVYRPDLDAPAPAAAAPDPAPPPEPDKPVSSPKIVAPSSPGSSHSSSPSRSGVSSPRITAPASVSSPRITAPARSNPGAMTSDEIEYKRDIERAHAAALKQNHYEFIGVMRPTDDPAVRAAYVRLAREYHPDRVASGPLSEDTAFRDKVDTLFKRLGEAQNALATSETRASYDRTLDALGEAGQIHDGKKTRRPIEAKSAFTMAETYFKKREYKQAEAHYRQAANFDSEDPRILTALAWCIFNNPDHEERVRVAEAKKRLLECINVHRHGDAAYRMGLILRKAGDEVAAQRQFATAHRLDPQHVEANREVRLAEMRREKADDKKDGLLGKLGLKK